MRRLTTLLCLLTASAASSQESNPGAHNWPQFRGTRALGIAEGDSVPAEWDVATDKNVAWKTPIPGMAHSSPIVWGDRVFVTTAVRRDAESELSSLYGSRGYGAGDSVPNESEHQFALLCLDKNTGEVLWTRTAHEGVPRIKRHPKSSHANPTPATDGKRVVAYFGSEGLYSYDLSGELQWKRDFGVLNVGAPDHPDKEDFQWGVASSPVLHDDRVFVQCDQEGRSFVAALDANTGEDLWRVEREEDSTWSTPTVHAGEHPQLIINGYKHIGGYDLRDGEELWKLVGGGDVPIPTPVVADGLVFLTSAHGRSRPVRAVRVQARGLLNDDPDQDPNLVWQNSRRGIYTQTPLVHDGLLYCCSDGGVLSCYEADSGTEVYRQRVGAGATGFSGSPVLADGKLFLSGESGQIFVIRAGREFEEIATNEMAETCMATPAISAGTLFIRTRNHLVAVREEK